MIRVRAACVPAVRSAGSRATFTAVNKDAV